MQAPSNFQPDVIQTNPPALTPPRYRKFDLYRDVNQFRHCDSHAVQVSTAEHQTFRDLLYHLVYSRPFASELERARTIFRWMTSKNMYTIRFGQSNPGSPEALIMSFKNSGTTYARIFETLCQHAGLHCVVLTGFAKGLDYRPGDKFEGTNYNHSWNAVYIDYNWHLVDSHWATRYLISEKNMPENLVYEYDDFYFLTDPEQLIYSHWAHRPENQLLTNALPLNHFEDLPLVKSYFFKGMMYFKSHHKGVISTNAGRLALSIGFRKLMNFTYKIVTADTLDETYKGQKLKNYALQETEKDTVTFVLRAPKPGAYFFTIFAQILTGEVGIKNVFTASAEYKVIVDREAIDAVPLPNCSDSNWGPGIPVDQLGLVASQTDPIITTADGKVEINFRKTKPANILCKLRKPGLSEDQLEQAVSDREQDDTIIVNVDLPEKGEYGLEVYGNDPNKDGETYTHICQYFVHFASPKDQEKAFYQETPERRMKAPNQQAVAAGQRGYKPDSAGGVTGGMLNLNIGPDGLTVDPETLPPPPPEFLQQQYLYGAAPASQQGTYGNVSFPQGQGQVTFTPGTGTALPAPQQAGVSQIQPSKAIVVEQRSVGQQPPQPPASFKLIPVRTETEETPAPVPPPVAQKPSKDAIDKHVMQSMDDHAIQVAKSEHTNFRDLVWDLLYSKDITNEIEKVRCIFRWLATKNLKEMNFDDVEKGSPEDILMGLKTGKTTYAMVFETMCNYAGLHSKIISGYAKGADYAPGQHFTPGTNQHSWNAVYIYGTWCLVDAHWAARRIIGKQSTSEEFHYQLDDYFFLPDPHQLIYTHFPDDPKWQLLDRQVTLEEFENMPHMKPQFFKYGLEFVSHRNAVIIAKSEINIRLRYPSGRIAVSFSFGIEFEDRKEEYKGIKLSRWGMQESCSGIASFRLRLPVKTSYKLYIYAREELPENKDTSYAQVCEFKIIQEELPGGEPAPFPPCPYLTWAAGPAFYKYGLDTYQQSAVILTREGKAELQIRIPSQIQFMAKLKHNDRPESELEGYVMHRIVGNTAYFNISCPGRGEYGLEIYANNPDKEGTTLYHVAQYIIECNEDVQAVPLPKLPPGYLGAQPKFNEFGLNTLSHHDPVIHLDGNFVNIQLAAAQEMRVTANLIQVATDDSDLPDFVFTQTQGSVISFSVALPETGFYKLQLYAIPVRDPSQQLPGVYNYLINSQKMSRKIYPYPKQYAQWKEGCSMPDPLVLHPDLNQDEVNFCVCVPKAQACAIVADQEWTHLKQTSPGMWEGQVKLGAYRGKNTRVTLNSNYGGDKTSYATLLEYRI